MPTESELEYLYGLTRFGIKPGIAVMEQIMELLGHPEQQFKSIHVTGTNGKGSTCAMIESLLRTSGQKTALYTSPHLYAFNERIRVGGESISDEALSELVAEIRAHVERENIQPTFFEFTTALAFLYFARSHIDIAVIEVGMGGRFDATNVITPEVSVITNVGLDH
ncbi:MAG: Mur ligase family protein, partial [Patescibacteria group bacterium]